MLAGAGKAEIDLEGVLPFDGFCSAHDPLCVRAVVMQNPDDTRACLLSVDATSLRDDAPMREAAVRAVGCPPADVWVTVTHTFSAPHVRTPGHLKNDDERERNKRLAASFASAVLKACAAAVESLVPARLQTARGTCSVNVNRDVETEAGWWLGVNPDGFSDRTVRAARLVSTDSERRIVATIYSADVQPSVTQGLQDEKGLFLVSSDLAGEASRLLEERHGGVAVFLVGTAGDQAPRAKGPEALRELGRALAAEVDEALAGARPVRADAILLSCATITVPAQRIAEFGSLVPTRAYEFVPDGTADLVIFVARLGDLAVFGVQPELDSSFGARLREAAPGRLEILTMVNGAAKYLPGSASYDRITYEAMNSRFGRGADELLAKAVLELAERPRPAKA
ncbi:hypothetical protein [Paratractidigestivibacter sp.]|uniref:hypothetical protein n=1 Tax=Paratractidigestivibacter sp. TaxID=2847316 RepID=UPI002AC8EE99|nr:hypothetical protein [Paratractidigestivibacter sp.]